MLKYKVFWAIMAALLPVIVSTVCYGVLEKKEVHSQLGSNNFWSLQRIGITSEDRIWVVYQDTNTDIIATYSDTDGNSWTEERPFGTVNVNNPSLYVGIYDSISAVGDMPGLTDYPLFNIRNGSWSDLELTTDDDAFSIAQVFSGGIAVRHAHENTDTYDMISWLNRDDPNVWSQVNLLTPEGYEPLSLSACKFGETFQVIWHATNEVLYQIQTAYYNGEEWSTITVLDSFLVSESCFPPTINTVGDNIVATWCRSGVGINSSYAQVRWTYADELGSWENADNVTDRAYHNYHVDTCSGYGEYIYLVYSGMDVDPNNHNIQNLMFMYYDYDTSTWSEIEVLTEENTHQEKQSIVNNGNMVYILWADETSNKQFIGGYDTGLLTPSPQILLMIH